MTRLRQLAALALAAFSISTTSCVDTTAPKTPADPSALLGLPIGIGGGVGTVIDTTVKSLQWTLPLLSDISRSATIGPDGGSIEIPETGFRLDVPKGAVAAPTLFTVTAVQGSTVAYEFQPAGLTLAKRLTVTQGLGATSVAGSLLGTQLTGAYFTSRDDLYPDGTALVHELEPTTTDLLSLQVRFTIGHFSGYIVGVD